MSFKRNIQSITDSLTNKVDKKLIEYISRFINDDMSDLEKAVSIYLCLGDVLCYSTNFCLDNDYNKLKLVGEINQDNNEMICKSWSILYKRLLKYFGINSKLVKRRSHYKVEMVVGNVIYSMDATAYGNNGFYYGMSDTARIKFGFRIEKIRIAGYVDPNSSSGSCFADKELEEVIDKVYEMQNRKIIPDKRIFEMKNKVCDRVQAYGEKVGVGTLEDLNYRTKLINRFWGLDIRDSSVEKNQLFNYFMNGLFEDYQEYGYEYKSYSVYGRSDGKLKMFKMIAFEIDGEYYYLLEDGKKFTIFDKRDVMNEFYNRGLKITEFTEIIGLWGYGDVFKVKSK